MKLLEMVVIESSIEGQMQRERERGALSVQKAEETCLFASDVVNADSL